MKNYYDILGVLPDADIQTVKFTYKALAKIYHPDTYQGDKKYAEKKMKDINEVYKCLSNQKLRSKYDNAFFSNKAKSSKFRDFNENQETSQHEEPINDEWHYAIKYHPELIRSSIGVLFASSSHTHRWIQAHRRLENLVVNLIRIAVLTPYLHSKRSQR